MKKILLFLFFLLMSIGVWGATETAFSETFASCTGTFGWSGTAANGDFIPDNSGWSVSNAYGAGGSARFGTGSKKGTAQTPAINCGSATTATLTFKAGAWNGSSEQTTLYLNFTNCSGDKTSVTLVKGSFTTYTVTLSNISGNIKIQFSGKNSSNSRFLLDDVVVTYTSISYTITAQSNNTTYGTVSLTGNVITGSPCTGYRYADPAYTISPANSATVSQSGNAFTVTPSANTTITINFEQIPPEPEPVGCLRFSLLTDIEDLVDGDSIVIVNGDSIAMSTTQNSNNRGTTKDIYYNNYKKIVTLTSEAVQIIQVKKVGDNWALNVGTGYLYADGANSNNYLKTRATNTDDNKGYWGIAINEDNEASIVAQCSCTRNTLQFNRNGSKPIFSCYNSSQEAVKIYKKINSEYTVIFKNNGINYDTIYTTRHLVELPIPPTNTLFCKSTSVFVGWSSHDISTTNEKPDDLFQTIKRAPLIESDKTFYAVFADEESLTPLSKDFTLTIDKSDFVGGGYDACNGPKKSIAKSTDEQDTIHIVWTSDKIYKNASAMQWQASNGVLYNNTNLGTITSFNLTEKEDNTGVYTTYFGSTEQPSTTTTVGNSYFKITIGNKYGRTTEVRVGFTKNITPKRYSNYTTYCIDTLVTEGNWNTSANWKFNRAPEYNEAAVLLKPVTVNIEHGLAKYVVLDQSSPNSGKLTIQANKGLEVQDTISVFDGTTYHPTTTNDIVLESGVNGNASLIFNNSNNNQATVWLYSKAQNSNDTWNWQYMGTAMTSVNALYNYYGSWIYKWVGAPNGWEAVPNGGTMYPWLGYCITQENPEWYETAGTLVPTDTEEQNLIVPANSDMVFANSWTAPIRIGNFTDEDFDISPKNVYLFNTGYAPYSEGGSTEATERYEEGKHIVIPIHSAPYTGDSLISSQQGFFVTNSTNTDGTITLNYGSLVRTNNEEVDIVAGPMHMPKHSVLNAVNKPTVMKIWTNGSLYNDRVVILEREDFSRGFDDGWDGNKTSYGTISPSIYIVNEDDSHDAVSAIPDYEGTLLGFKAGTDIVYSINFEYDGDEVWYLNDVVTETSTIISNESKYVFTSDGTDNVRFIISSTPYSNTATGNVNVNVYEQKDKPQKYLHDGKLYIIKNNRIFNAVGNLVK